LRLLNAIGHSVTHAAQRRRPVTATAAPRDFGSSGMSGKLNLFKKKNSLPTISRLSRPLILHYSKIMMAAFGVSGRQPDIMEFVKQP
jgi:hypothetical protein